MTEITQERDPWARVPFWLLTKASPSAVVVYAALARYANLPEGAIPSINTVAEDLRLSYRTVQRAISELSDIKAIRVEHRFADGNEKLRLPSRYHLVLTSPVDKSVIPPVTSDATPPAADDATLLSPVSNELEEVSKKKEVREKQQQPDTNDRGTRLPQGWMPSPANRAKMAAERPDVDLKIEHAKFTDHWVGKPGRDGRKSDWEATWRNWIRNARSSNITPLRPQQATRRETPPAPDRESLPW